MAKLRIPHYFESGTPALASEMNANFQAIENWSEAGLIGTDSIEPILTSRTGGGAIFTLNQTDTEYALAIQNGSDLGVGGGGKSAIYINQSAPLLSNEDAVIKIRDVRSTTQGSGLYLTLNASATIPAIWVQHGSAETLNLKKDSVVLLDDVFEMTPEYMKVPRQLGSSLQADAPSGSVVYNTTEKQLYEKKAASDGWAPVGAPVGSIVMYAGATAPAGWLLCNGDTIPNGPGAVVGAQSNITADFSALYAVLNAQYGVPKAAGKLPDLRGAFVRGTGTNAHSPGSPGVAQTGPALGDWQADETAVNGLTAITETQINTNNTSYKSLDHQHATYVGEDGGVSASYAWPATIDQQIDGDERKVPTDGVIDIDTAGYPSFPTKLDHRHSVTISEAANAETRPFSIGLNYIIKY